MKIYSWLFILFSYPTSLLADFDYNSYQPSTYSDILKHQTDLLTKSVQSRIVISTDTPKYVIPVTFIKELRKISPANKAIITAWQQSQRVPDNFIALYQHEFKAIFDGNVIWIPVQEELLLPMSSELHPGDRFELFVILIGSQNKQPCLLATEFKSGRTAG